ncbi:hypothetical protein Tco_0625283 [Tanacetum coccineum]|uniref:Uncharacterized protein n=1 Tax=Tanacetum coccineum TaxID=301880 RepID=A0ABQ4WGD3_9ASTR
MIGYLKDFEAEEIVREYEEIVRVEFENLGMIVIIWGSDVRKRFLSNHSDLTIQEPDNSLKMGDEHLDTIPATESDEVIKSSVENLVPIPSEFEGISDDTCDVPNCDNNRIDPILEEFADELAHIAPIPPGIEVNDVEQEEKEFDLEDILQIQDVILREKLLNVSRLISNIESLKDNPIPIMDSDSSETSLSFSDNSLPEFESFSDHSEETRSGL